jgi:hypothetical protein
MARPGSAKPVRTVPHKASCAILQIFRPANRIKHLLGEQALGRGGKVCAAARFACVR